MLKKIIQTVIDLGLAFILIKICVDDSSSYFAGLCTMLIWFLTDDLLNILNKGYYKNKTKGDKYE